MFHVQREYVDDNGCVNGCVDWNASDAMVRQGSCLWTVFRVLWRISGYRAPIVIIDHDRGTDCCV